MFMIDLHTKFHIRISKWLSGTATRLEGLRNFSHDCHVVLQKYHQWKHVTNRTV